MKNSLLVILVLLFSGCGQDDSSKTRQYTEITIQSPLEQAPKMASGGDPHAGLDMGSMAQDPHAGLDMGAFAGMSGTASEDSQSNLTWNLPKGWKQSPASKMRLATLRLASDPTAIDCSIISLPGGAGGLEPNLRRWMGQIGLDVPEDQFTAFMANAKDKVFDFSLLQKGADQSQKSMIAAMLTIDSNTIFVKMTGTVGSVSKNKKEFSSLIKSVRAK